MDNYKLDEVKKIIDEGLLSSDVLENILKNTTRRIENTDDSEALKILEYLSESDVVPSETKIEIDKYLAQYNTYYVEKKDLEDKQEKNNFNKITIIYLLVLIMILVLSFLLFRSRS